MKNIVKKVILAAIAFAPAFPLAAQTQTAAQKVLEDCYKKLNSLPGFTIRFSYKLDNAAEKISQTSDGTIHFKGNKYHIYTDIFERLYDEKYVYTILNEEEEVTVEKPENAEASFGSLKDMIKLFEKNFDAALDKKQTVGGKSIVFVRLTPKDKKSATDYLLVGVEETSKLIYSITDVGRNGTSTILQVKTFSTDKPADNSEFIFNEKKYKDAGYYISTP